MSRAVVYRLFAPLLLLGFVQVALSKRFEVISGNQTCLLAEFSANFSVSYETTAKKGATVLFSLPENAHADNRSNCNNMTAPVLVVSFGNGHSLSMNFTKHNGSYKMDVLTLSFNESDDLHFPNASSKGILVTFSRSADISAKMNTTYRCTSDSTVHMENVNVTLSHVRMEAFPSNGNFSKTETICHADMPPTVPSTTLVTTLAPTTVTPPTPNPIPGVYNVTNSNGTCLLAKMGLQINITYTNLLNESTVKVFNILPNSTHADGNCSSDRASLQLTDDPTKLIFVFVVNTTTNKFYLKELSISTRIPSTAQGKEIIAKNDSLTYLQTTLGKSYMCHSEQTLQVSPSASINTFELHIQPFRVNDAKYGIAEECQMDKDDMLIPIIVGAALAGLVLIVLIAYLIGRKRSHAGYQTI
ncbi:lysosome-associated membrane glycoprotein 1a [Stegostoma tigrinum]|uniref:lysosome-associated membrane glycoprotein 1a n=1 Tax=Stegostoma tigrinum TaxID=3053191 RepID=UPI00202AC293|nr:lysosome-associated membrane glycoprotein 1a [Stegostoma tigrinum]